MLLSNTSFVYCGDAYNLGIHDWELVDESPFARIKIPSGDVKRVRYLSQDEETSLMHVLP